MSGGFTRRFVLGHVPIGIATMPCLLAQTPPVREGAPDAVFSTVPFAQWLQEDNQTRIRWTVQFSEPRLSNHQRLLVNLTVQVDGVDLAKRRGEGQFTVFVQVNDEKSRAWQNHQTLDLEQIQGGVKADNALFTQSFFVLPGDYTVSVAIFDSVSREHGVIKRNLHVAPLKHDPLPEMWHDLPTVEFLAPESSSDRWYLPSVQGRLKLTAATRRSVNIDMLVNLTASERFSGSTGVQSRNLGALIPAAKVLSQVAWDNAKFSVELLDLARRRVAYRQDNILALDWSKAKNALDQVNPGIIDVRSLANRRYSADFFLNRISRRIAGSEETTRTPRAVIILGSNVFFEPGVEMHPIALGSRPDLTVIYIRYHLRPAIFVDARGRPRLTNAVAVDDELAPLLKPLAPHVFDVSTPEQFRRTLSLILELITEL